MATKLRDIAAELGLHESTISRALANSPRVKKETRRAVHRLSKQLDYRPNAMARSFALRRTHTIGLTVGSIIDPFFAAVTEALERHIREKNYDAILNLTEIQQRFDERPCSRSIQMLLEKKVDGLVIWTAAEGEGEKHLDELAKAGLPFVVIGCEAGAATDFVAIDREKGGYLVTEHLIRMGHKRIAYVNDDTDMTMLDRTKLGGYRRALEDNGIGFDPQLIIECKGMVAEGYDIGRKLAASPRLCTAIFGFCDTVVLGVLRGIREAGLSVPDDMAIAGFNGIAQAAFAEVPLTTVDVHIEHMAQLATDILMKKLGKKNNGVQQVLLEPELVVRASSCKTAK